jgi:hypothetical protein
MPDNSEAEILLDVSELEPPEPLVLTLEAAEQLKPGQYVRMLHRREPCMLYGELGDNFSHFQREGFTAAIEVFIWRSGDVTAKSTVSSIVGESV